MAAGTPQPAPPAPKPPDIDAVDLGRLSYADAFKEQQARHKAALEDREAGRNAGHLGTILLVEHDPPVITVSQRPTAASHLLAGADTLARMGVQVEETDRGGDITYHGPGQLVAYPIIDLNRAGLRLHPYIRLLEQAVIDTAEHFGVPTTRDTNATGVWTTDEDGSPEAKLAAIGVRVRRWIAMHGLAMNISTNLDHFRLIVPCGLVGRPVTSLKQELRLPPTVDQVKPVLLSHLRDLLTGRSEVQPSGKTKRAADMLDRPRS